MPTFETFRCSDCAASFAVESAAIDESAEQLTCPLCESEVEIDVDDEIDEEDADLSAD